MVYYVTSGSEYVKERYESLTEFCGSARFCSNEKVTTDLPSVDNAINFHKMIENLNKSEKLICDVDNLNYQSAFELGYFIARCGDDFSKNAILFGNDSSVSLNLSKASMFKSLKYRCFNLDKITISDYMIMGLLYNRGTKIITYSSGPYESNFILASAAFAHFNASELQDKFEGKLEDYILDPNDYDSFRRIKDDTMIRVASETIGFISSRV